MGTHRQVVSEVGAGSLVESPSRPYRPPVLKRLGSLAELTRGGTVGPDDGLGGAGGDGSV